MSDWRIRLEDSVTAESGTPGISGEIPSWPKPILPTKDNGRFEKNDIFADNADGLEIRNRLWAN